MNPALWDTSALVPLCVQQRPSPAVRDLLERHEIAVWWATPVEMHSAFERLLRMSELTVSEHAAAHARLAILQRGWRELQPSHALRSQAEALSMRHPLKAADALQLAAAWVLCSGNPQTCVFISGDGQLLQAAQRSGFQTIAV